MIDRESFNQLISGLDEIRTKYQQPDDALTGRNRVLHDHGFANVQLCDLRVIVTLGVGGFGRVELVRIEGDNSRAFGLKKMKKSQIVETRQQQHIMSEKEIMEEANCDFIVKLYKTFKDRRHLYMVSATILFNSIVVVVVVVVVTLCDLSNPFVICTVNGIVPWR